MQESGLRSLGKLKQDGAGRAPSLGRGLEEAQQLCDVILSITLLSHSPCPAGWMTDLS